MGLAFHGAERLLECALFFLFAWIHVGVLFATTALLQGIIVAFGVPLKGVGEGLEDSCESHRIEDPKIPSPIPD